MPTEQSWYNGSTYITTWSGDLSNEDMRNCFNDIRLILEAQEEPINVLFDLMEVKGIPFSAPTTALSSGAMSHRNLKKIAVVGMNMRAQILADIVARVTRRPITFFETHKEAVEYLHESVREDGEA